MADCKEMTSFSFFPLRVMLTLMDGMEELPVAAMGETYGNLRIVNPRADEAMLTSIKRYGQLTPVICAKREGYELLDGFKRLRACRRIGKETLKAKILEASERVCKAAIIQLNRLRPIRELEEAMVLSSLYREDGLTQTEIALLLGRHKSWVSRRIALIERLSEEVLDDIRLGLLPATVGRELAPLPRGNQNEVAAALIKHRLSTREAAKLIAYLVSRPRWEQHLILARPWEVVGPQEPKPLLAEQLLSLDRIARSVAQGVTMLTPVNATMLSGLMSTACASAETATTALKEVLHEPGRICTKPHPHA
jgi:ParB/RepB/Spo0J family partition protein